MMGIIIPRKLIVTKESGYTLPEIIKDITVEEFTILDEQLKAGKEGKFTFRGSKLEYADAAAVYNHFRHA